MRSVPRVVVATPTLPSLAALALPPLGRLVTVDEGEIHLWYTRYDALDDPDLLADYMDLLDRGERVAHARFLVAHARHEYLVTRALVRTTLSRYAAVSPRAWRFGKSSHGRPFVAAPNVAAPLTFNLSHAGGFVVCAVARASIDLGVDVEDVARDHTLLPLADRFFSPAEVMALTASPEDQREARFFWYWTLKEAYIKARGMGLSIPLDRFSFSFDDPDAAPRSQRSLRQGPSVQIAFERGLEDDPSGWHFALLQASGRHVLAVAARGMPRPTLRAARVIPLEATSLAGVMQVG